MKRLFPPNASVSKDDPEGDKIQLSPEEVDVGRCEVESISDVIKESDASYLLAFFKGTTNGITASIWKFSNHYTKQVNSSCEYTSHYGR
jgi:hypothetical protein